MKCFRKICATFFLIFMLALPVLAGDMGAGGFTGDLPPGEVHTPGRAVGVDYSLTLWLAMQGIFIR